MAQIRIDDLPPDTGLTPEELEQILGAGRPSFRPQIEALEGRELYAVNVTAGITGGVLQVRTTHVAGTGENDAIALRRINNQIEVVNSKMGLLGPTNQIQRFDAAQVKAIDLVMQDNHHLNVDLTGLGKLNNDARFITQGKADVNYIDQAGRWVQITTSSPVYKELREVYNKADGVDRKLLSREGVNIDGVMFRGEWQGGQWVEWINPTKPSSGFMQRIEVRDGPFGGSLLSQDVRWNDGTITHTEFKNGQPISVTKFSGEFEQRSDGTVRMATADGLKVYQRVGNGWKLISSKHQVGQVWVEESWGADGTYTQNVWKNRNHGLEGSADHISKTVVKDGVVTTEVFRANDVKYASHKLIQAGEAKVTVRYSLNADGTPKDLLMYEVRPASASDYLRQTWTPEGGWTGVNEPWKGWAGIYGGNGSPSLQTVARFLPSVPFNLAGETLSCRF
jgi:hypothetical protein